jgi:hypothetical protein
MSNSRIAVKVHNVTLHLGDGDTRSFLVRAQTAAGAKRDVVQMIAALATSELATGEQLYYAGQRGQKIIGLGDADTLDSITDPDPSTLPLPLPPSAMAPDSDSTVLNGYGGGHVN